jgi:hypothetical protein
VEKELEKALGLEKAQGLEKELEKTQGLGAVVCFLVTVTVVLGRDTWEASTTTYLSLFL